MTDTTLESMQLSLNTLSEAVERLIAANRKYRDVCEAALTELQQRSTCDPDTAWMNRHIVNLRNALPPTITKQLTPRVESQAADLAGLVWRMGQTSMNVARAANG